MTDKKAQKKSVKLPLDRASKAIILAILVAIAIAAEILQISSLAVFSLAITLYGAYSRSYEKAGERERL